jgi:beta-lactamase regulating signal transducer with metallopeptidase domain
MTAPSVAVVLCLIHASVVVTATMLVRSCVGRRFAASRAAVGGVGMTCILLVTVLTFLPRIRFWPDFDVTDVHNAEISNLAHGSVNGATETPTSAGQQSVSAGSSSNGIRIAPAWLRRLGDGLRNSIVVTDAAPRAWKDLLVILLLGGTGVGTIRLLLALRAVRRLYRTSTAISDERVGIVATELKRRCRCWRPIELRETNELESAATFGFRKPVILLPAAWKQWSHDELAAVLAHEVAHIHRGDFFQRLIAQLGTTVHFYHPLVRASARCLAADQEFAADRLACGLLSNAEAYVRGLAKLALRFDDSFDGDRSWSNLSIMPKSSDFLARRLEMLRTKNGLSGKRSGRIVSACASVSVVLVALATTLLRGAGPSPDNATAAAPKPSEAAPHVAARRAPDKPASDNLIGEIQFGRAPFDVSVIPHAEDGAFLIRLHQLLRYPEVQPHVDELNRILTDGLRELTNKQDASIDLWQVEWVAGVMQAKVKMLPGKEAKSAFVVGADPIVIRMTHAGNWQEMILKNALGATLERFEGQPYVQSAMIPALGPNGCKFRFPDNQTIIVSVGSARMGDAVSNQSFFDSKPAQQPHAWIDAWRAVDGGLVTFVCDNSKTGWSELPKEKQDWPEFTAPFVEKTKYLAIGWDCTEKSKLALIRIRGTCADRDAVKDLHLASSLLLNRWPEVCQADDEGFVKNHTRILQLLSSVKIQPSGPDANQHFVQASAEMTLKEHELLEILKSIFAVF